MEEYKSYLFSTICSHIDTTIEEVEKRIKNCDFTTINRNAEGKIHSRYLGDRYEPAIIINIESKYKYCYYLFDGDIKDCIHPFHITYYDKKITDVAYYSSERIKNGEPNIIDTNFKFYNRYQETAILDEYESKYVNEKNIIEDPTLCYEMIDEFTFKFVD